MSLFTSDDIAFTPDDATSLVHEQKSVTDTHRETSDQDYRFRHSRALRQFWLQHLHLIEPNYKKVQRFRDCGSQAFVEYSAQADAYRIRSKHCGNRICPACRSAYAARLRANLDAMFRGTRELRPKFLTLTLRPSAAPLADQVAHLRAFFRRLRSTPLWKKAVRYGLAVVEVTRGSTGKRWHVHLHAVLLSDYMPQQELSRLWRKVTHGSFIVDIRPVKQQEAVSDYIAGYVTKPPPHSVTASPSLAAEWYNAVTRAHWVVRFGIRKLIPKTPQRPKFTDWKEVCSLELLLHTHPNLPPRQAAHVLRLTMLANADQEILDHVLNST